MFPIGLKHPKENIRWICGKDEDGKFVSTFYYMIEGDNGTNGQVLKDKKEALFYYNELMKEGWSKIKMPTITIDCPKKT